MARTCKDYRGEATSTARPFVFEKVWSQIEDEVRQSAENEKWSGSFVTLDPTLHEEGKHVREPKRDIASVDYLQTDGLESKSPRVPLYWRRKAPRIGKVDSPARGVRKRNEIRIHPHLHCVSFAMKILCVGSGPSAEIGRPFSDGEPLA